VARGFYCLFDENEQLLIDIVQYFFQNNITNISLLKLKKELTISAYQANIACKQLSTISDNNEQFSFSFEKSRGLTLNNVTTQTVVLLTMLLAKNSLNIKIFLNDALGMGGSRKSFLKKAGISQSTYYRSKKKMFYGLQQEFPDQKMNNEIEYRALLQHITFFFFGNEQFPLKESSKQVHDMLNFLILNWQLKPTYAEKRQLSYFLVIQLLRIKNKQMILGSEDDLLTRPSNSYFARTKDYLSKNLGLTEEQAYHEALFFNAYIMTYNASPLTKQPLFKRKNEINKVTNQQLKNIETNLTVLECRHKFPIFTERLTKLNTQTLSPFFFINTYLEQEAIARCMNSYPVICSLAKNFIRIRQKVGSPSLSLQSLQQLFYQYTVLIFSELPESVLDDQIHIVADFSVGSIYNRFIQKRLVKLTGSNIVIDSKITKKTDLFISDKFYSGVKTKQITWNCPPTAQDWHLLKSLLVSFHSKINNFK